MVSEAFVLGHNDFRLPGIGSYMSVAVHHGNLPAMVYAVLSMVIMIVFLDIFLWKPVVAWSQKFRIEDTGVQPITSSFFLNWLRKAGLLQYIGKISGTVNDYFSYLLTTRKKSVSAHEKTNTTIQIFIWALYAFFIFLFVFGCLKLYHMLQILSLSEWSQILWCGFLTLLRVLAAVAIGTLWALPAGLAIGLSSRLSRILQPVIQIIASFPAPMLFAPIIIILNIIGINLGFGSIVLMLLGTQWYILFNVIAGAMSIPDDLRDASRLFNMNRWQRMKIFIFHLSFHF